MRTRRHEGDRVTAGRTPYIRTRVAAPPMAMAAFRGRTRQLTMVVSFVALVCVYVALSFVTTTRWGQTVLTYPDRPPPAVIDRVFVKNTVMNEDGSVDLTLSLNLPAVVARLVKSDAVSAATGPALGGGGAPLAGESKATTLHPAGPRPAADGRQPTADRLPLTVNFVMQPREPCANNTQLRWIVYVHSTAANSERRAVIRDTWASSSLFRAPFMRAVFITGLPRDPAVQRALVAEHARFDDIVQCDFIDHYRNLTLKAIAGLKWVSRHCAGAAYALKADDDAFINIFALMRAVEAGGTPSPRLVACPLWKRNTMPILRDPKKCMKWCVDDSMFPGEKYFPQYCAGLAYVLSRAIIPEMYARAVVTPYFWIDDVFMTGIVLGGVKDVHYVDLLARFTLKEALFVSSYLQPRDHVSYVIGHIHNQLSFRAIWKALLQRLDPHARQLVAPAVLARAQSLV